MSKPVNLTVYTMCRSGNHAIIFWLINNICPITDSIQGCCYWNSEHKLYFYNNCNHLDYTFIKDYQYQIKSYEDTMIKNSDDSIKIVILRDFTNFIASRYKKYGKNLGLNDSYLQNYEEIRDLWINLCNEIINDQNVVGIIYNKWLTSKEYRDSVGDKLGIPNINDNINIVSDIGEGSSFCGVKLEESNIAYLNRFSKDLFRDTDYELYEKIIKDYECNESIKNIRNTLFN